MTCCCCIECRRGRCKHRPRFESIVDTFTHATMENWPGPGPQCVHSSPERSSAHEIGRACTNEVLGGVYHSAFLCVCSQDVLGDETLALQLLDVARVLLTYCGPKAAADKGETSAVIVDLIATLGFFCANNAKNQVSAV